MPASPFGVGSSTVAVVVAASWSARSRRLVPVEALPQGPATLQVSRAPARGARHQGGRHPRQDVSVSPLRSLPRQSQVMPFFSGALTAAFVSFLKHALSGGSFKVSG